MAKQVSAEQQNSDRTEMNTVKDICAFTLNKLKEKLREVLGLEQVSLLLGKLDRCGLGTWTVNTMLTRSSIAQ